MKMSLIKSKERIRDHGEVFTPEFVVNDMLSLVNNEVERFDSKFLEPACGDGNFLAYILEMKLNLLSKKSKNNQVDFEKYAFISICNIYGIDILEDNVLVCKDRLFEVFKKIYTSKFKKNINTEFLDVVRFVIDCNILNGDALSLKRADNDSYIVFPEWSFLPGNKVKRRDFVFKELADFTPNEDLMYSKREVSDLGSVVFSPMPIMDYPAVHYLKIGHDSDE
jgi:hypothetical protein